MDWNPVNKINPSVKSEQLAQCAFFCLLVGKQAEAFLCLLQLSEQDDAAVQYNLALCYITANEWQTAANYLEKALSSVKKIQVRKSSTAQQTIAFKILRTIEAELSNTFPPMPPDFPQLFPEEAQQDITMVLIHVYKKCNLTDKAKMLAASLIGESFACLKE